MLASFSAQFTWVDWLVVVAYLGFTTWLGAKMGGRQATIRDFFLGGRKLPWWAVSGSIVATEISALTFVSVPWIVFQRGGNFTYLQLGLFGSLFARILVGYILVPAYYKREIYSPYDYMHNQLGGHVRGVTTGLFVVSGLLAQSARIYLTAEVVNVVLHDQLVQLSTLFGLNELAWAIILISGVSVAWTLIGGMTAVIWTDVVLFLAFLFGAFVALGAVLFSLDNGLTELLKVGWAAKDGGPWGKFTFFDFNTSPLRAFTIWTAAIASTWGGLGAYGTDQLMAQRMFCCRSPRDARRAIIGSAVSLVVTVTVAFVGVGLYTYYQSQPLQGEALSLFTDKGDRIFPIFIVEVIPRGIKGLIVAAIFAAAISSVMGILTALSQTVQTAFYEPLRQRALRRGQLHRTAAAVAEQRSESAAAIGFSAPAGTAIAPPATPIAKPTDSVDQRHSVLVSRLLVLFWGTVLSVFAYAAQHVAAKYPSILEMGLAMAGYCGGGLLAGFALGFLPLRADSRGYVWAAPLSLLYIFALVWHQDWAHVVCWVGAGLLLLAWIGILLSEKSRGPAGAVATGRTPVLPAWAQFMAVLLALSGVLLISYYGHWGEGPPDKFGNPTFKVLAWPWYIPIGSVVAFVWGYGLARIRPQAASE